MNFETLPNEVLLYCFEYLNGGDIYYSFNNLNNRLSQLIDSVPLYLDFRETSKDNFNKFCDHLFANDDRKQRVYSIKLSNHNTSYQIHQFLVRFTFQQFPQLHSLTFIDITQHNISQLLSKYRTLSQLLSFHLIDCENHDQTFLFDLHLTKLRTLTISKVFQNGNILFDISRLNHLTISECSLDELNRLLNNADQLKSLTIKYLNDSIKNSKYSICHPADRLKRLTIGNFACLIFDLKRIFVQTPNLQHLTLTYLGHHLNEIKLEQWKNELNSLLKCLKTFQFYLQLQNSTIVYSSPYILDIYSMKFSSIQSLTNSDTFVNVKQLTIDAMMLTHAYPHRFFHVTSLVLTNEHDISIVDSHIECLNLLVNLSNIRHFEMSHSINSTILLKLFRMMPKLNSLSIDWTMLKPYLDDQDLCEYLNNNILKFRLLGFSYHLLIDENDMKILCTIFSRVEHFICSTNEKHFFIFLIKNLSELLRITAYTYSNNQLIVWLEREARKLGLNITTDFFLSKSNRLSIWIDRDAFK